MVVGHKNDMFYERVIPESDGERFASANGLSFIETSAGKSRPVSGIDTLWFNLPIS